mmetsp:Transcript_28939/g.74384  ORF Transcript_28939/g.74384 Transcript_28939/m.74384 type:complete len:323 (+) Transcript_28939:98-1066(+)|eukprot:CAMPEP_0115850602 /NCGR_PEP_ID=MMETSP0287-20121206/12049_1 /TAXON_ID=412157 /ORGANISM="Chrysochromulina rotalis, Strain UIO044" /LENGTH=322 /DNA_ID=CAMNT_0003304605 /DNA_START=98 /DNA_END=1066 /DNA_ORIENTATION=-
MAKPTPQLVKTLSNVASIEKEPPLLIRWVDRIGEDEGEPKSYLGAILSAVATVLLAIYTYFAITNFTDSPFPLQITAKWTIVDGPVQPGPLYPMTVECLAPSCEIGVFYTGSTAFSANCNSSMAIFNAAPSVGSRLRLLAGEAVVMHVCYSDDPSDGLYAWYNGSSPFGIGVESVAPIRGSAPQAVRVPVHSGRTLLKLVNTTNATYPVGSLGHAQAEWYPTLLSPQPLVSDPVSVYSSQTFIDSQWTEVLVFDRDGWTLLSTVGGAWTLIIGAAALTHKASVRLVKQLVDRSAQMAGSMRESTQRRSGPDQGVHTIQQVSV